MAELSGELQDELVALVRDLHADHVKHGAHDYVQDFVARTAIIVSKLPQPVDPDLIEARRIAADHAYRPDTGPYHRVIDGSDDTSLNVKAALAAIKRGRELERAALSKAQGGAK